MSNPVQLRLTSKFPNRTGSFLLLHLKQAPDLNSLLTHFCDRPLKNTTKFPFFPLPFFSILKCLVSGQMFAKFNTVQKINNL